jgi:2-alkenal reductase
MLFWAAIVALVFLAPSAVAAQCAEPFTALFERVSPAVISIQAMKINKERPQRRFETIVGSGFVIDRDGHALTNAHVVDGAASLSVTLDNGDKLPARTVGLDPVLDLALIRVEGRTNLAIARFGDSSTLRVGEEVVVIGNPIGLDQTMTRGIVSGLNRLLPGVSDQPMIQTDAPINPGNSGGPLLNLEGEVVGVNAAIASQSGTNSGVGFSIPVSAVQLIVPALIEDGSYDYPYLGVLFDGEISLDEGEVYGLPETQGAYVLSVSPESPADQAGLVAANSDNGSGGDLVVAIDGQAVQDFADLNSYLVFETQVGQTIQLTVLRDGEEMTVPLTLGSRP